MLLKYFSEPWDGFQPNGDYWEMGGWGSKCAAIPGFIMITMTNKGGRVRSDTWISDEKYD